MKYNLKAISDSRLFLFGIATVMILFFHSSIIINPNNFVLKLIIFIKQYGNVGVDIFLFLSAIGLFHSMSKNQDIKAFYKRRFIRILPALLLINSLWFAYISINGIKEYLFNVTGISIFFNGNRTCWYFTLLLLLYFIYPPLFKLEKKFGSKIYIFMIIFIIILNVFLSIYATTLFNKIEIMTRRIPIFLIGCIFAKYVYNGVEIKKRYVILISPILCICCLILYNLKIIPFGNRIWRYILGILAIALIILLSNIYYKINKKRFIEWIGMYSMEFYLLFEKFLIIFKPYLKAQDKYNFIYNLAIAIITLIGCIFLKITTNQIVHKE